jgi:hypothetical protein
MLRLEARSLTKLQKFNPPWSLPGFPLREAGGAVPEISADQFANGDKAASMWAEFFSPLFLEKLKEEIFIIPFAWRVECCGSFVNCQIITIRRVHTLYRVVGLKIGRL